uniref:3-hydroxybutyryl-CoA dehydrogenase n=1 Tax=Araucaria cunninghamii TaxID=56994 RepID=A0A0D6R7G0_ARACU
MGDIKVMGVVGSGQMGSGIAQLAAIAGISVFMMDSNEAALQKAMHSIRASLHRFVKKGEFTQESVNDALEKIKSTTSLHNMSSADIIIEAIVENEHVKKHLFSELDLIAKPSAILASNTSSISINRLASATQRSHQVIGMHFMNPPPIMKLVEIVRGSATTNEVFGTTKALAERFGKTVICSQDYPGFIVNRILMPMINEAFYTLYTGVATKEDIDCGMKLGTSHPMGPLELADFIGLDVCLSIMKILHSGLGESKYCPCPLLVQYVDAGYLGKKTGRGVYRYGEMPSNSNPRARM